MILKLHLVFIFQASRSRNIQPKFRLADFFIQLGSFAFATEKQYGGDRLGRRLGVWWEGKKRWRGGGWAGVQSLKISQSAEHRAEPRQSSIPSISAIFVAFSIMSEVCLISWWQLSFSSWDIKRHTGPPAPPAFASSAAFCQKHSQLVIKMYSYIAGSQVRCGDQVLAWRRPNWWNVQARVLEQDTEPNHLEVCSTSCTLTNLWRDKNKCSVIYSILRAACWCRTLWSS